MNHNLDDKFLDYLDYKLTYDDEFQNEAKKIIFKIIENKSKNDKQYFLRKKLFNEIVNKMSDDFYSVYKKYRDEVINK